MRQPLAHTIRILAVLVLALNLGCRSQISSPNMNPSQQNGIQFRIEPLNAEFRFSLPDMVQGENAYDPCTLFSSEKRACLDLVFDSPAGSGQVILSGTLGEGADPQQCAQGTLEGEIPETVYNSGFGLTEVTLYLFNDPTTECTQAIIAGDHILARSKLETHTPQAQGPALYDSSLLFPGLLNSFSSRARVGHTLTQLPDGTYLVAGGRNLSGFVSSERVSSSGARSTDLPEMNIPRYRHSAVLMTAGRYAGQVLIFGGLDELSNASGTPTALQAERFDPATNSFELLDSAGLPVIAPEPFIDGHVVELSNGYIIFSGGNTYDSTTIFDPYNILVGNLAEEFSTIGDALMRIRVLSVNEEFAFRMGGTREISAGDFLDSDKAQALSTSDITLGFRLPTTFNENLVPLENAIAPPFGVGLNTLSFQQESVGLALPGLRGWDQYVATQDFNVLHIPDDYLAIISPPVVLFNQSVVAVRNVLVDSLRFKSHVMVADENALDSTLLRIGGIDLDSAIQNLRASARVSQIRVELDETRNFQALCTRTLAGRDPGTEQLFTIQLGQGLAHAAATTTHDGLLLLGGVRGSWPPSIQHAPSTFDVDELTVLDASFTLADSRLVLPFPMLDERPCDL